MTDEITIFARVTVAPGALVGALVGAIGAWYSERGAFKVPLPGRVLIAAGGALVGGFFGLLVGLLVGYAIIGPGLALLAQTAAEVADDGWTAGRVLSAVFGLAWIYGPAAAVVHTFRSIGK